MRVLIAGATGFVGRALVGELAAGGHEVRRLTRRAVSEPTDTAWSWNPAQGEAPLAAWDGVDAVINLAGEPIAAGRWTRERRRRIAQSRFDATQTLVDAMTRRARRPEVFLSASAIGFYGDRGEENLPESAARGEGFLAGVCEEWEARARTASALGVRTVALRFGVVLGCEGGALHEMLPWFRAGLGARLGSGRQWMSWISLADAVRAIRFALETAGVAGPVNLVAPEPVRQAVFAHGLAGALHRPCVLAAPAGALRLAFGTLANETLLASQRVRADRLERAGFAFRHRELSAALADLFPADG